MSRVSVRELSQLVPRSIRGIFGYFKLSETLSYKLTKKGTTESRIQSNESRLDDPSNGSVLLLLCVLRLCFDVGGKKRRAQRPEAQKIR